MSHSESISDILRSLNAAESNQNITLLCNCLYEIQMRSLHGLAIESALPTVVKLLRNSNTLVKRLAGEIVCSNIDSNPDMVLLAVNSLVQDFSDVNPVVRGIALKLLATLNTNSVTEFLKKAVSEELEDKHVHPRRVAVLAVSVLHKLSPGSVLEGNLWDMLYCSLRDPDPIVVASAICSLEEIFSNESGIVVSTKLGQYLIENMPAYSSSVQKMVLKFLTKYSPKTKENVFEHMNYLDDLLSDGRDATTSLHTFCLFSHFIQDIPNLQQKAFISLWESLKVSFFRNSCDEYFAACLNFVNSLDVSLDNFSQDYVKFIIKENESICLAHQKIILQSKLLCQSNATNILKEFSSCSKRLPAALIKEMVLNVLYSVRAKPELEKFCVSFICDLLQDREELSQCIIEALSSAMSISNKNSWLPVVSLLSKQAENIENVAAKINLLNIMSHPSLEFENCVEIFEMMLEDLDGWKEDQVESQSGFNELDITEMKLSLLTSMVKCCLDMPAQVQPILSKYMEACVGDPNNRVKERALFLYGYLKQKCRLTEAS